MRIVAREGDLTNTNATAVVNAGNTSLWLGSGVAGAIRTAGGPSIQQELNRIASVRTPRRVVTQGDKRLRFPCEYGECVVTHAGAMKADFVFHAAVMDSQGPHKSKTSLNIIQEATRNCVLQGRQLHVTGMSFPIFGTGVGGMDLRMATSAMMRILLEYGHEDTLYRMYAYGADAFAIVEDVVKQYTV